MGKELSWGSKGPWIESRHCRGEDHLYKNGRIGHQDENICMGLKPEPHILE